MRRLIRDISSVLIISGVLLVLDAAVTLVWQEPITAVVATIKRSQIDKRFLSFHTAPLNPLEQHALSTLQTMNERISFLARREEHQVTTGAAIGRIVIKKIGASFDIVQGTDTTSLEKGPGHYPGTAFPGLGQTVAIAGHRTTYLAPFRHIDSLAPGDQIVLKMPYARFTYIVQYHKIVLPTALWVTNNVGYERLVLSACNPLYSAAQRIIVFARLQEVQPTAATVAAVSAATDRTSSPGRASFAQSPTLPTS
ncbi:MAG TPA: class E sortase [Solirubrobacteraceae bacterium]|nr:class E sortase [Solirubrobacteraceae bacterium]